MRCGERERGRETFLTKENERREERRGLGRQR